MNKFIKSELLRCQVDIPDFDDSTTHLVIYRQSKPEYELVQGHFYIIELASYIINEPSNFTLSVNWNNGTKPAVQYNKVEVSQIMGKMIKLNCVGYDIDSGLDLNCVWSGWVPSKAIKIIKELK